MLPYHDNGGGGYIGTNKPEDFPCRFSYDHLVYYYENTKIIETYLRSYVDKLKPYCITNTYIRNNTEIPASFLTEMSGMDIGTLTGYDIYYTRVGGDTRVHPVPKKMSVLYKYENMSSIDHKWNMNLDEFTRIVVRYFVRSDVQVMNLGVGYMKKHRTNVNMINDMISKINTFVSAATAEVTLRALLQAATTAVDIATWWKVKFETDRDAYFNNNDDSKPVLAVTYHNSLYTFGSVNITSLNALEAYNNTAKTFASSIWKETYTARIHNLIMDAIDIINAELYFINPTLL